MHKHTHQKIRAYILSNEDTIVTSDVLTLIRDWMANDGTFLYTLHGNIRLRVDPTCPLEITSFSDPECSSAPPINGGSPGDPGPH